MTTLSLLLKVNLLPIFWVIFPLVSSWVLLCQLSFSQVILQHSPIFSFPLAPEDVQVLFTLKQTHKKRRENLFLLYAILKLWLSLLPFSAALLEAVSYMYCLHF